MRPVGSKYLLEEPLGRGATGTVWRARQRETAGAEAAVRRAARRDRRDQGPQGGARQRRGHRDAVPARALRPAPADPPEHRARPRPGRRGRSARPGHGPGRRPRPAPLPARERPASPRSPPPCSPPRSPTRSPPATPTASSTATSSPPTSCSSSDGGQMHPMLTDFGIARLADSPGLTRTHEFVGTPAYVAPESAEGRPQTSAVDIYGAGILLYELVTGRPPFAGGTALEVLHQHLSEEPRRPSTVPEPLWTVIERCLRKNPDERPSAENLARGAARRRRGHRRARHLRADRGRRRRRRAARPRPGARRRSRTRPGRGRPDPGAAAAAPGSYDPNARDQRAAAHRRRRGPGGPARRRRPDRRSCRRCRRARRGQPAAGSPRTRTPGRTSCGGPRPQRADAGPVPRPERGPAAPPPPAAGRRGRSSRQQQPQQQQPPQRQQHAPSGRSRSSSRRSRSSPQQYAPAAAAAAAVRARRSSRQQPRSRRASRAQPRQRSANPMRIPGPRLPQGLPVHDRHPVRRGLADLGAEPAPGLGRHRQELLGRRSATGISTR